MQGFFDLKSPDDLFEKLERDNGRLRKAPTDTDVAFDFVVTAWHLLDWLHPNDRKARNSITAKYPIFKICQHLANGAKHFELIDPNLKSVESTDVASVWGAGVWAKDAWAPDAWKNSLVVRLKGEEQRTFGDQLTILDIADRTLAAYHELGFPPKR